MDWQELGKTPIPGDAPAGEDPKYNVEFEQLSEEMAKLGNPLASGPPDWKQVITLSSLILETQAKHLLVACYYCEGMTQTEGLKGMASGFRVIRDVIETFWETLYPPKKRMKGRKNAILWWEEKTKNFLSAASDETWPKEDRDALIEDLKAIDAFLGEQMDDAPLLRPMVDRVQKVITEAAPPKPDPVPETLSTEPAPAEKPEPSGEAATVQAPQPTAPSSPPPSSPKPAPPQPSADPGEDPEKFLKQALTSLSSAATGLKKADPLHPAVFRLSRIAAWIPVKMLPPATGGKTMLPPPDSQVLTSLKGLYESGNWPALLESAESRISQNLFWLDLSRYVAEALEQLGKADIAETVGMETRMFVSRLPGIEKLSFSDGTPFADMQTQEWLKSLSASGDGPATNIGDSMAADVASAVSEAIQLIKEKKNDTAFATLTSRMAAASSLRETYLWQMAICRLLIQSKKVKIAEPYVDAILTSIDTCGLEIWEPDLALEGLCLCVKGIRLSDSEDKEPRSTQIIKRISMLSPLRAMELI